MRFLTDGFHFVFKRVILTLIDFLEWGVRNVGFETVVPVV